MNNGSWMPEGRAFSDYAPLRPVRPRFLFYLKLYISATKMNAKRLDEILEKLDRVHVAVVGDYFLDRYWLIDPKLDEPSVETGLTAYQVVERRSGPGAAGTVVNNLAALGLGRIYTVGFHGRDGEGYELAGALDRLGVTRTHLLETAQRHTPCYTKPLRDGSEMNRFDIKNFSVTPREVENRLVDAIRDVAGRVQAIAVMDQVPEDNHGVLTDRVREALIRLARENPDLIVYVDSRKRVGLYTDMIVKCNEHEALESFGFENQTAPPLGLLEECGVRLAERTGRPVFITLGPRGQLVVASKGSEKTAIHVPGVVVEGEIDICGAGDASSAAIVSALCAGATYEEAARLANLASSITIRKIGRTGTASREEIRAAHQDAVS